VVICLTRNALPRRLSLDQPARPSASAVCIARPRFPAAAVTPYSRPKIDPQPRQGDEHATRIDRRDPAGLGAAGLRSQIKKAHVTDPTPPSKASDWADLLAYTIIADAHRYPFDEAASLIADRLRVLRQQGELAGMKKVLESTTKTEAT
jgi:hypothetical protein